MPFNHIKNIPCHIVLEVDPTNPDSWLQFETFPETIVENYSTKGYYEVGGSYMPQPIVSLYRGGNWGPFNLELEFRAGERDGAVVSQSGFRTAKSPFSLPGQLGTSNATNDALMSQGISDICQIMIDKVRWCQALAFPLAGRKNLSDFQESLGETEGNKPSGILGSIRHEFAKLRISLNDALLDDIGYVPYPPIVLIFFGTWWTFRGYVRSVKVEWGAPWHPETVQPYGARVSLSMQPLWDTFPVYNSVRGTRTAVGSAEYKLRTAGVRGAGAISNPVNIETSTGTAAVGGSVTVTVPR